MKINIHNKSEMRAEGKRTRGNCTPIFCLTTGEVYSSATDAAEKLGVRPSSISWVITGRMSTVKGRRFCKVSEITDHLDELSEAMQRKSAFYDYHKANKKLAEHKANCEKLQKQLDKEMKLVAEAEREVKNLSSKNNWIM